MGGWMLIVMLLAPTVPWWAILLLALLAGVLIGSWMILRYRLLARALDKGESAEHVAVLADALRGREAWGGRDGQAGRKGRRILDAAGATARQAQEADADVEDSGP